MASVRVPGTCGELVQGMVAGRHFLVSCPIDLFSTVVVEVVAGGGVRAPAEAPKAAAALRAALAYFGVTELGAMLHIESPIPRSKGMGSSTADVAGAIYALAAALGRPIAPAEVAGLALAVEPTNSSLFPGLALLDHRRGSLCEELGPPPVADVLVLDCGGEVDTLAYNAIDRDATLRRLEPLFAEALHLVREGVRRGDLGLLGAGATLSARTHQAVLPKPPLEDALALGCELGAAGVCVGHSGTVIGVLFPPQGEEGARIAAAFSRGLAGVQVLGWRRLIGGGCYASPRHLRAGASSASGPGGPQEAALAG